MLTKSDFLETLLGSTPADFLSSSVRTAVGTLNCTVLFPTTHHSLLLSFAVITDCFPARGSFRLKFKPLGRLRDPRETGGEQSTSTSRCERPGESSCHFFLICAENLWLTGSSGSPGCFVHISLTPLCLSSAPVRSYYLCQQGCACPCALRLEPTAFDKRMQDFSSSTCECMRQNPWE